MTDEVTGVVREPAPADARVERAADVVASRYLAALLAARAAERELSRAAAAIPALSRQHGVEPGLILGPAAKRLAAIARAQGLTDSEVRTVAREFLIVAGRAVRPS